MTYPLSEIEGLTAYCASKLKSQGIRTTEALLEAALRSDADVLMIGRSHQPGGHDRMRDLIYAMVRDSPFPVLSV